MKSLLTMSVGLLVALVACEEPTGEGFRRGNRNPGGGEATGEDAPPIDPNEPGGCALGEKHVGFANEDLSSARTVGGLGKDRRRVKPFSAMDSELRRVLGGSPSTLAQSAAAFGDVPPRWYAEPVAGAVSIYTTYSVAFTACYDSMSAASYAQAPTTTTATAECASLQKKAWQRAPTADETKSCADLAVVTLASEASPRRRWAHACASVLTAAGFNSY